VNYTVTCNDIRNNNSSASTAISIVTSTPLASLLTEAALPSGSQRTNHKRLITFVKLQLLCTWKTSSWFINTCIIHCNKTFRPTRVFHCNNFRSQSGLDTGVVEHEFRGVSTVMNVVQNDGFYFRKSQENIERNSDTATTQKQ